MLQKLLYLISTVILVCSCSSDEDPSSIESQRERILKYLKTNNLEYRLVNEVYIVDILQEDNTQEDDVQGNILGIGDSAELNFAIYQFNSTIGDLVNTNIDTVALEHGFENTLMTFESMKIKYGETPLISGLSRGINGIVEGQARNVFMTSEFGYGESITGTVPINTSLMMLLSIENIKKND